MHDERPATIQVKPWGDGQGEFVVINAADFDPSKHQRFDDTPEPPQPAAPRRGRPRKEPAHA